MNRRLISWGVRIGMCAAVMALAGDDPSRKNSANSVHSVTCSSQREPYTPSGRNVFVDPKDGRIIPRPNHAPLQAQNDLGTSGEGLREAPGKTKGGGIKVHLQGRFRSTVSASMDSSGRLTTRCQTEESGSTR
jgi:hypothetical protein